MDAIVYESHLVGRIGLTRSTHPAAARPPGEKYGGDSCSSSIESIHLYCRFPQSSNRM